MAAPARALSHFQNVHGALVTSTKIMKPPSYSVHEISYAKNISQQQPLFTVEELRVGNTGFRHTDAGVRHEERRFGGHAGKVVRTDSAWRGLDAQPPPQPGSFPLSSVSSMAVYQPVTVESILGAADLTPAALHPMAGLGRGVDYLNLDDVVGGATIAGGKSRRGWTDELAYGAGASYFVGENPRDASSQNQTGHGNAVFARTRPPPPSSAPLPALLPNWSFAGELLNAVPRLCPFLASRAMCWRFLGSLRGRHERGIQVELEAAGKQRPQPLHATRAVLGELRRCPR
ncbi:MAG: hypothetical protein BJ554DRAFT_4762 [Olpidium bornovanus]|uniref:Uncharacterized protein n=1 Tax=Olpidium bornovanus TaxID=278681 RepID=A0A8H8A0Q0_9FUNG|nr:MAG: hypothetical protein BJ554DRAFT_4762 [Olpidium bornovanus]